MGSHTPRQVAELLPGVWALWEESLNHSEWGWHGRSIGSASNLACLHFPSLTHGKTSLFCPMVLCGFSRVDTNKWLFIPDRVLTAEEMIPPEWTSECIWVTDASMADSLAAVSPKSSPQHEWWLMKAASLEHLAQLAASSTEESVFPVSFINFLSWAFWDSLLSKEGLLWNNSSAHCENMLPSLIVKSWSAYD